MPQRASVKILFSGVLIGTLLFTPASADDDFRIYGTLYGVSDQPLVDYHLVFHDLIADVDLEITTDGTGAFAKLVPHRTFRLVSILGPAGEAYEVRTPVTITDGRAGVRVSVRLVRVPMLGNSGPTPSTVAEATVGTGAPSSSITQNAGEKRMRGAAPWWKKPGPVVGIVLGSGLVVGLAIGSGSGGANVASASMP